MQIIKMNSDVFLEKGYSDALLNKFKERGYIVFGENEIWNSLEIGTLNVNDLDDRLNNGGIV